MRRIHPNLTGLLTVAVVGAALGIPMLILQRYVAETRGAAIALVAVWLVLVGIVLLAVTRGRPDLRLAAGGTWVAVLVGTVAIGYWTGFRDTEVMEDVAMASTVASAAERDRGLGGGASPAEDRAPGADGPVELASGAIAGADGHSGTGTATVVERPDGARVLTLTGFEVDPGPNVEVYLTPTTESVSDRVELGDLKGNVGDQQYEIPGDADLREYSNLVLWCTPFTTRIAVAELG